MKKLHSVLKLLIISSLVFYFSCSTDQTNTSTSTATKEVSTSTPEKNEAQVEKVAVKEKEKEEKMISWVDNLNVRKQPNVKSAVVAQVKENEPLTLTGEQTDFTETIRLRGISYTEPWVKIKTADHKLGWVFRGAVKREGEEKGTEKILDMHSFNKKDLATWTKLFQHEQEAGDASTVETVYKKSSDNLIVQYIETDMGDYGYSQSYKLFDTNYKLLKSKRVNFGDNFLNEDIKDLQSNPANTMSRSGKAKHHYLDEPVALEGDFKTTPLKDVAIRKMRRASIIIFPLNGEWTKAVSSGDGCSCSFRSEQNDWKKEVFATDIGKNACIKINDKVIALEGGRTDNRDELVRQNQEKSAEQLDSAMKMRYKNETYDVIINANVDGKNDSGGDTYEGILLVKSKDGTILGDRTIWGSCGC